MLLDLSAPFHLRCVTEYIVEPKVRPLLLQTRGGINARLGIRRDVVLYDQMVQFGRGYDGPSFPQRIDRGGKFGEPGAIIAPNKLHHLFVQDYIAAYPKARVYAAPGLQQKRPDLRFDDILSDTPQVEWRGQVEQHLFRGASPLNEVVFFHPATRTLILTDLAFNIPMETARKSPLFYMLWDVGHFGPHRFVRLRGIRDWEAARNSVERILRWDFDRIILSHGDVLDEGGREHFAGAFAFLRK